MRLLFVHEVNYQRKVVYEIHDIPELLSLRGHQVTFVDFPEGAQRRGFERLLDLRTRRVSGVSRAHPGAEVELVTPGRVARPPLDRLAASLTHVPVIRNELRTGGYDAVVLYGVPTNGWQTVGLAHRYGVPVLFRAIDISHELRSTAYRTLIRRAEHHIFRKADGISVHNVALREYAIAAGADPSIITVDYPGLDLERFAPGAPDAGLIERYGIGPDDRVVLFMGTFFRFGGLDWLLDALAPALGANPRLKLLLMGGGEADVELRAKADAIAGPGQIVFTGFIGYPDLADHLRLGHVAVNPFAEQLVTHCALPGKILQYAGTGLPTVCTRLEGMQGMIPEGDGVFYRAPGSGFVDEVLHLIEDDHDRDEAGRRARATMERLCRWDLAVDRVEAAIEGVVSRPLLDPR